MESYQYSSPAKITKVENFYRKRDIWYTLHNKNNFLIKRKVKNLKLKCISDNFFIKILYKYKKSKIFYIILLFLANTLGVSKKISNNIFTLFILRNKENMFPNNFIGLLQCLFSPYFQRNLGCSRVLLREQSRKPKMRK